MAQQHKIGTHATSAGLDADGFFVVRYHTTDVIKIKKTEEETLVIMTTGGWHTNTTKTRINQALNQCGVDLHVFQKGFEWFIQHNNEDPMDFSDGVRVLIKGGRALLV